MYIGVDHSTTGVKTSILSDSGSRETFVIERSPENENEWSYIDILAEHVDLDRIQMVAVGYSYGDNFGDIRPIDTVENRGVVDNLGAGHPSGTGSKVFDDLQQSELPCVAFPGVNHHIECLLPYFRHYDTITGADKVAMTRYAQEQFDGDTPHFIAANASSSAMATLVNNGTLVGAFHWIALVHGWAGLGSIRRVLREEDQLSEIFMASGILRREGYSFEDVKQELEPELLEKVYHATLHNVYSLLAFSEHIHERSLDGIVISGRLSRIESPYDMQTKLRCAFSEIAPVHHCSEFSTATGAALIGRDVSDGAESVLGLPVKTPPLVEHP